MPRDGDRRIDAVLPDQAAVASVDRLDDAVGVVDVDRAAVDERRGLIRAAVAHRPDPSELQLAHVVRSDLRERAEARRAVVAADHRPIAGRRAAQHLIGHRHEVLHCAFDQQTRRPRRRRAAGAAAAGAGGDRLAARGEQPIVARRVAVALQDVRHHAEIAVLAETSRALGRHRRAQLREQVVGAARAPLRDELVAGERRGRQRS